MSSLKEIKIAIDSIQEFNKPYLIGAHISEGTKMPSGELISELKSIFKNEKTLGVILSCISPENYDLNFEEIKKINVFLEGSSSVFNKKFCDSRFIDSAELITITFDLLSKGVS